MRIFVINLDRSPARLAFMRGQLRALGLAFERVSAVDGHALGEDEIGRHADLTPTEIACFLSHRRAWESLLRSDANFALVLEDDAILSDALFQYVTDESWFPPYARMVKVEAPRIRTELHANGKRIAGRRKLHRMLKYIEGAAGYVVSRQGARILLDRSVTITEQVDCFIFNDRVADALSVHQMVPALVLQRSIRRGLATGEFASTIANDRVPDKLAAKQSRPPLAKKLAREIRRPVASLNRRLRLRLGPSKGIVRRIGFR